MYSANATIQQPLEFKEGYAVVFNNDNWEYIEDHRGQIIWKTYEESKQITQLGIIPEGWSIQQPQKPIIISDLSQFLYQQKCKVAYTGVKVIKNQIEYLFETTQDSITMCNSMALAITAQPNDFIINWKVWKNDTPTMLSITKEQFNSIFSFGMLMINTAFSVQGLLNQQLQTITQQQLADTVFVEEFKTNAISEFSKINTTLTI